MKIIIVSLRRLLRARFSAAVSLRFGLAIDERMIATVRKGNAMLAPSLHAFDSQEWKHRDVRGGTDRSTQPLRRTASCVQGLLSGRATSPDFGSMEGSSSRRRHSIVARA